MLCYMFWKSIIDEIKSDLLDTSEEAFSMLALIIATPVIALCDILISPYSISYLIVSLIRKRGK